MPSSTLCKHGSALFLFSLAFPHRDCHVLCSRHPSIRSRLHVHSFLVPLLSNFFTVAVAVFLWVACCGHGLLHSSPCSPLSSSHSHKRPLPAPLPTDQLPRLFPEEQRAALSLFSCLTILCFASQMYGSCVTAYMRKARVELMRASPLPSPPFCCGLCLCAVLLFFVAEGGCGSRLLHFSVFFCAVDGVKNLFSCILNTETTSGVG